MTIRPPRTNDFRENDAFRRALSQSDFEAVRGDMIFKGQTRWFAGKLWVNAKSYGARGDRITNDSAAIEDAANSLGATGGTVYLPPPGKYLINNNLTLPPNVTLKGPFSFIGQGNASNYGNISALIINPDITITLGSGSGIDGCLIYRKGMTFPTTNASAFAGTAITLGGNDCFVFNSMILGFNKAIYSVGPSLPELDYTKYRDRMHIQNVQGDNLSGIEIINCWDIGRLSNIHLWPFSIWPHAGDYKRSGTAFKFLSGGDWNKVTDSFCWGYKYGYRITSCNSMTLLSCGADNPPGEHTDSIGFIVETGATDTRLIGCQAAGHKAGGYYINTNAETGLHTQLIGCDAWHTGDHGVLVDAGDVSIIGGMLRNVGQGITCNTTTGKIFIDQVRFNAISGSPICMNVSNNKVYIGTNDYGDFTGNPKGGAGTYGIVNVVAGDPLNLPTTGGEFVIITGDTAFGTLNHGFAGREVKLLFTGSPLVYNAGVTPGIGEMRLAGSVNFQASPNIVLTLKHNGILWYEVSRQQLAGGGGGAPTDATYVCLSTNATLTNERVLTGTANQITVTDGGAGSSVTLSAPQNLHTEASPTFTGLSARGASLTGTAGTSGNVLYIYGENTFTGKFIKGNLAGVDKFWFDKDGGLELLDNLTMNLDKSLSGRDTGGTARRLIGLLADNVIYVGYGPQDVNIGNTATDNNPVIIRVGGANNKRIEVGAPDSGGTGYRMIRVLN